MGYQHRESRTIDELGLVTSGEAFRVYYEMGKGRTLKALEEQLRELHGPKACPPRRVLNDWWRAGKWEVRIAKTESDLKLARSMKLAADRAEVALEGFADKLVDARLRHLQDLEDVGKSVIGIMKDMLKGGRTNPATGDVVVPALRLVGTVAEMRQLAAIVAELGRHHAELTGQQPDQAEPITDDEELDAVAAAFARMEEKRRRRAIEHQKRQGEGVADPPGEANRPGVPIRG